MIRLIALVYCMFKADKRQDTPYLSTCLIVIILFIMGLTSFAVLFDFNYTTLSVKILKSQKLNRWINSIIQINILCFIFILLFPKKKLEEYEFNNIQLLQVRKILIFIIIISIIIMTLLLIKKGIQSGAII